MKRPTIMDIARRAGVSKGAVSYALRGEPGVSAATRERIHAIAAEMGWQPNRAARALSAARAEAIGIVFARPANLLGAEPFFMRFIAGVESALEQRSWALVLQVVNEQPDAEPEVYRRWWGERRVDGVLVLDVRENDPRIHLLDELGLPAVLVAGKESGPFPTVRVDNETPMREAVEYLVSLGHRRIAHVAGIRHFIATIERRRAFSKATSAAALTTAPSICTNFSWEEGARVTHELLSADEPPTAIIYDNDVMAVAATARAQEMGVRIPADLSVIAWDDSPLCQLVHPPLTTLSRDIHTLGLHAARHLIGVVDGMPAEDPNEPLPELVVRGSTGPPGDA